MKWLKYLFLFSALMILGLMLLVSRRAGVTCDEVLHFNHSVNVYDYYATSGRDQSALNTPVTHLQYYGQSFDNLVTILIKWFNIDDVYGFRHIMSTLAGWLVILITALFAVRIEGYGAGILVMVLFAVSPTFLGHAQNNLKDVPFALGYIAGLYYILSYIFSDRKKITKISILLTASIAFCISIRAGGLILICYLFFFMFLNWIFKYFKERRIDITEIRDKMIRAFIISVLSYFLSTLLWPYALQNPFINPWKSYLVMLKYPDTFRELFNGRVEWSDFMPWYYLPEYMAITIPIVVLSGILLFLIFSGKIFTSGNRFIYLALVFSVLFPISFVILKKSNVYSSWRQFLFLYPAIVLIAAVGFIQLFRSIKKRYLSWILIGIIALLLVNPAKFMILNPEYSYIYYNQLVGGLKGAYGRFETDYYFVSLREASEWLINYLKTQKDVSQVKIRANFSVKWFFRDHPEIQNDYFRYEERSQYDWDYAIITNRYIPLYQLQNRRWPPENAIKIIYADSVPVCAVLKRKSKDDLLAWEAFNGGRIDESIKYFEKASTFVGEDELFYFNFAAALYGDGQYEKADSLLMKSLKINPDFDLSWMYLGNIAAFRGKVREAEQYYEKVISLNRKYFEAYVELSKLVGTSDVNKARNILRSCLEVNSSYKPAIIALADTYRVSDPEMAKKIEDVANKIKP
jgi:tetratricopeptide (TPR) repeat protein